MTVRHVAHRERGFVMPDEYELAEWMERGEA